MRLKFVHAADLHLDSPFRGLGEGASQRLLPSVASSTVKALERLCSLCIRERVDFLTLAGDLFELRDRSVRAHLALHRELFRLHQAGVRTFVVHGNHDPLSSTPRALELPPSVKVFGATWEEVAVSSAGGVRYRVQGISYPRERVTEDLSTFFRRQGPEFTVGVLHANLGGQRAHADYAPCTLGQLSDSGLDYWALGHVHTRAVHQLRGGALAVYPGNIQGRHVNEEGPRGCVMVEVPEQGRPISVRFFPLDAVRWHQPLIEIAQPTTLDALFEAALEQVSRQMGELSDEPPEGFDAHAVRLTLVGRGPLRAELTRPGALAALEDALRERLALRSPPVLLESLRDETSPELDLAQLAASGGLSGAIAELASQAGVLDELFLEAELDKVDAALHRLGLRRTREEGGSLIDKAAFRALELLLEDGT